MLLCSSLLEYETDLVVLLPVAHCYLQKHLAAYLFRKAIANAAGAILSASMVLLDRTGKPKLRGSAIEKLCSFRTTDTCAAARDACDDPWAAHDHLPFC